MIKTKIMVEHLWFWMLYGLYFYALNALGNDNMTVWTAMLSLPYFAFVFYMVHYIIKRFMARKHYARGTVALLCFYVFSSLLVYFLSYGWHGALIYGKYIIADYDFSWREFLQTLLVLHGHFSLLALLYFHYCEKLCATEEKLVEVERRLEAEEQKEHYEYTALAGQVCPHMMANIFQSWAQQLNTVRPTLSQQMDMAYRLMRFYMEADDPKGAHAILLEDEIKAVQNYLYIQQHILDRIFFVDIAVSGNMLRFATAPTTLLTLVENAFKHGETGDPDFPVRVQVQEGQQGYSITVSNRKRPIDTGQVSHGQGLKNLKRRLDILYGSQTSLTIEDTAENYHISILTEFNHLKNT